MPAMSDALYFYGVNGTRGGYLVPPIKPASASTAAWLGLRR